MARAGTNHKGGRPKGSKATHTLEASVLKQRLIEQYSEHASDINNALLEKALEGDIPAIKELYNRVWGAAKQEVEMTGKDGKDLFDPSDKIKALAHELIKLQRQRVGSSESTVSESLDRAE